MPGEYKNYLQNLQAQQNLRTGEQLQTLRDLQIEDVVSGIELRNIKRRLETEQTQAELDILPQKTGVAKTQLSEADRKAWSDNAVRQVRTGTNPQTVVDQGLKDGYLPAGTELSKQNIGPGGAEVWSLRNSKIPQLAEWSPFDPKVQEEVRAYKSAVGEAAAKLKANKTTYPTKRDIEGIYNMSMNDSDLDDMEEQDRIAFSTDVGNTARGLSDMNVPANRAIEMAYEIIKFSKVKPSKKKSLFGFDILNPDEPASYNFLGAIKDGQPKTDEQLNSELNNILGL